MSLYFTLLYFCLTTAARCCDDVVQIGEEYLVMLPECLPFLSELMEDSDRDVVAAVNETIRYIEEISGEKLDEYLQ